MKKNSVAERMAQREQFVKDYKEDTNIFMKFAESKSESTQVANVIRILPGITDPGDFFYDRFIHYNFKVDGQGRAYVCLHKRMEGQRTCPACELVAKLDKSKTISNGKEIAKALSAQYEIWVQCINRAEPEKIKLVKLPEKSIGRFVLDSIFPPRQGSDAQEENMQLLDPDIGFDLKVYRRSYLAMAQQYQAMWDMKQRPIGFEKWREKAYDMHDELFAKSDVDVDKMTMALITTFPSIPVRDLLADIEETQDPMGK